MNCFGIKRPSKGSCPYHCTVELLDGSEIRLLMKVEDHGSDLLQKVWNHLDLFEKDYFSLRFLNTSTKTSFWLDSQKNIQKQLRRHGVKEECPKFYFGVKFYAVDPCRLTEEITRYQFFQQLRRDVAVGRVPLSFDSLAELGSLVAQSEFGDYDPRLHVAGYLLSLKLTTDSMSDDLQMAITEMHRNKLRGMLPSQCEYMYLDQIKKQDVYGVEFYNVRGAENTEYKVGASPHGIVIYRGKHRVGLYHWPRIDVINFKGKELILEVKDKHGSELTNHTFTCSSTRVCKQLWKSCIEHHSFFRLPEIKNHDSDKGRLFHLGSKYRYSGRTEKEMASVVSRREQPVVKRPLNHGLASDRQEAVHRRGQNQGGQRNDSRRNDENTTQGMFTAANGSPGSVRSLKLKFQPKSTDIDADLKKQSFRTRTSRSYGHPHADGDRDSLKSTRSERCKRNYHSDRERNVTSQNRKPMVYAEQQPEIQSSVSRIVRSYIPNGGTTFFNSSDMRRHSERSGKPREYENIVYNDQGLPVILATHRGERADEKMPFYQQDWLHNSTKKSSAEAAAKSRLTRSSERASFSATTDGSRTPYKTTDPLMYNILNQAAPKTNLGFYEDKLTNRDSGTDSPTCSNNYDDHNNIFKLIQTLGTEQAQLAQGQRLSSRVNTRCARPDPDHTTRYSRRSTERTPHNPPVRVTII